MTGVNQSINTCIIIHYLKVFSNLSKFDVMGLSNFPKSCNNLSLWSKISEVNVMKPLLAMFDGRMWSNIILIFLQIIIC